MTKIWLGGIVLLLGLSSCATAHYRDPIVETASGFYKTEVQIDPREIKVRDKVDLSKFVSVGFLSVVQEGLKPYFSNLFQATKTVEKYYDAEEFADYLINQRSIESGGLSDPVGRYLLTKEIGPFLAIQIDCQSTGQVTRLKLRAIDSTTGRTVFLIQRDCTDGTLADFDSLLIYPVMNEYTKWFRENSAQG